MCVLKVFIVARSHCMHVLLTYDIKLSHSLRFSRLYSGILLFLFMAD